MEVRGRERQTRRVCAEAVGVEEDGTHRYTGTSLCFYPVLLENAHRARLLWQP